MTSYVVIPKCIMKNLNFGTSSVSHLIPSMHISHSSVGPWFGPTIELELSIMLELDRSLMVSFGNLMRYRRTLIEIPISMCQEWTKQKLLDSNVFPSTKMGINLSMERSLTAYLQCSSYFPPSNGTSLHSITIGISQLLRNLMNFGLILIIHNLYFMHKIMWLAKIQLKSLEFEQLQKWSKEERLCLQWVF